MSDNRLRRLKSYPQKRIISIVFLSHAIFQNDKNFGYEV